MPYRINLPKRVQKQLDALPLEVFRRLDEHIVALRDDPRPTGSKKMKGAANVFRVRVGDYRIIYEVDDAAKQVWLIAVGNRKDVY